MHQGLDSQQWGRLLPYGLIATRQWLLAQVVRDSPRLSVDIDLVYLPMATYSQALSNIAEALGRISSVIKRTFSDTDVTEAYQDKQDALRLVISRGGVQMKVEVSPVLCARMPADKHQAAYGKLEAILGQ